MEPQKRRKLSGAQFRQQKREKEVQKEKLAGSLMKFLSKPDKETECQENDEVALTSTVLNQEAVELSQEKDVYSSDGESWGMMVSPHSERVEMSQACANADICNVFEDQSIVVVLISWPCKNKYFGDHVTQALAAGFLYKLAQIEEGRRYLNYSSKISNDIKRVLRKKGTSIEVDTVESLNATLNLLKPVFVKNVTITYFNKSIYEGVGKRIICDLVQQRKYMTFNEVLLHLETLEAYSQYESSQTELILNLPLIVLLFKHLLMEYDNSEINMTVTSILNNVISKNKDKEKESVNSNTITETATQVFTVTRNEECQFPPKKASAKKINKSKIGFGYASGKFRQSSKRQVSEWEPIDNVRTLNTSVRTINRSKKFHNDRVKKIFVPLEE